MMKNIVIVPFCMENKFRKARLNKQIEYSAYCPSDRWFYISKAGNFRTVYADGSIYKSITDNDGWPSGYIVRIR